MDGGNNMTIDCIQCKGVGQIPINIGEETDEIMYKVDEHGKLIMERCPLCQGGGKLLVGKP